MASAANVQRTPIFHIFWRDGMDKVKLGLICAVCCAGLLTSSGFAQNLLTNGDFSGGLTGWTVLSVDPLAAAVAVGDGNPAPGIYLSRGTNSAQTLSNGVGQVIPVVAGRKYQVRGQWTGMIMGRNSLGDPNGTTLAEVNVSFLPTAETAYTGTGAPAISMQIKKRWAYPGTNPAYTFGVDLVTGGWAWEPIGLSSTTGDSESIVAPEGANYMAVWVNFACSSGNTNTTVYAIFDNLQVMSCQGFVVQDLNSDCQVNFKDAATFVGSWLACHLDPVSSCWN
jgi:hypothetical protein